jgi:hypothetical protein
MEVEQGALLLLSVAEAIRQQLIEYLIAPTAWARENAPARGEVGRGQGSRRLFFNQCVGRHDLSVEMNFSSSRLCLTRRREAAKLKMVSFAFFAASHEIRAVLNFVCIQQLGMVIF